MQAISSARQGIATLCRRSLVQFPRREARDVSTTSEPGCRLRERADQLRNIRLLARRDFAPTITDMKSRLLIAAPKAQEKALYLHNLAQWKLVGAVAPTAWRCWRRCAGPHPESADAQPRVAPVRPRSRRRRVPCPLVSRMKQLGRHALPRLILEIDIGQRLAVVVARYWSKRLVPRQSRAG